MVIRFLLVSILCGVYLSACGSGSSSGSSQGLQTGSFGLVPVAGLTFSTPTQSGVTDVEGTFNYMPGEVVTFSLGGVELGRATGARTLNVFDVAGSTVPTSRAHLLSQTRLVQDWLPLAKAMNLAQLLRTLDADQVPGNGIEIDPEVASRFANFPVDLGRPYGLQGSRIMRMFLYTAANAGELTPRPILARGLALEPYVSFTLDAHTRQEQDSNGDGVVDDRIVYTHNDAGRIIINERDRDGDGVMDSRIETDWDDNLFRTEYRRDDDADGVANFVQSYETDAFGSTVATRHRDAAGELVYEETQVWDEYGALVRRQRVNTSSADTIEVWLYVDGVRNTYELDQDADGSVDRRDVFEFNARGDWISRHEDRNLDGITDRITLREYNEFGVLTADRIDVDADGTEDTATFWEYNADRQLVSFERHEGGVPVSRDMTEFENQLPAIYRRDNDADGNWDYVARYDYDATGLIVQAEVDSDGDGSIDSVSWWDHDEEGQQTLYRHDQDNDGVVDRRLEYIYDGTRRTENRSDDDNDGVFDRFTYYYDFVQLPITAWF